MTRRFDFLSLAMAACAVWCAGVTPADAAALGSAVSLETLEVDEEAFFSLGTLDEGTVALGITTPLADLPFSFDFPDTIVATFLEDAFGPGAPALLTINDDSSADDNLDDDNLSSLYRFEAPETGEYTVGVTGFPNFFFGDPHDEEGDYLLTTGEVDPSSLGGDFADTDGVNETIAGADPLPLADFESKIAVNTLADIPDGDVDFYAIDLTAGDVLTAMTAPLEEAFDFPDTVLFLFDEAGDFLLDDDESGDDESDFTEAIGPHDGQGSAFHFLAPADGTYYLAVTGFPGGEDDLIVPHAEVGDYALLVSRVRVIPEPATGLLLTLGLLTLRPKR